VRGLVPAPLWAAQFGVAVSNVPASYSNSSVSRTVAFAAAGKQMATIARVHSSLFIGGSPSG